jgi:DNA-binding GntR family transcriptional regulator
MPQPLVDAETTPGDPIVNPRELVDWVRERIRNGSYVPGQRLIEADITRATGAPRAKVREALQRLETEGLVVIEEFRGASVRALGLEEARQIYGARTALEGYAAGEFARRGSVEAKHRLQGLQEAMDALESTGNHDAFAKINAAWHALIVEGSGNGRIAQLLSGLNIQIYRLLFATFYNAKRIDDANADHRLITAAIVAGRADEAEAAMRMHIGNGFEALSEIDAHYPA